MKKKNNSLTPYIFLFLFILVCMVVVNFKGNVVKELNASEFITELNNNSISELTVVTKVRSENYEITGKLKDYKENESFKLYLPVSEEFMKKIVTAQEENKFDLTIEKISICDTSWNNVCILNSKNITLTIYIRNKKNGEHI